MAKIIVRRPDKKELEELKVTSWGTWGCEVSTFDWEYDSDETAYVLEGHVLVKTEDSVTEINAGDLVTFPKGMKCVWEVKKPIRKHFRFE